MNDCKHVPFAADGPYPYCIIKYDGHWAFACDWGDCIEEIMFIYGHSIKENYIEYGDPKLTFHKMMLVKEND